MSHQPAAAKWNAELAAAAFEALPEPIFVFDSAGALTFRNRAAERFLDSLGIDDPVPACLAGPLERALAGEAVTGAEFSENDLWFECSAQPLGQGKGAVVSLRDCTRQHVANARNSSAGNISDFIYRGNLAGMLHTSADGRILDCNEAMARMLGYESAAQMMSRRAEDLYADAGKRPEVLREMRQPGPAIHEFEVCFRHVDGSERWGLTSALMLDDSAGAMAGTLLAVIIDITHRKLAAETLRQSEQRFSAFMGNLPGVAFIKDLAGRYVYYNEKSWQQFKGVPAQILGKTDIEIWPAEEAEAYRANDALVLETMQPIEFVESVPQHDGPHSWLVYKFPVVEDGKAVTVGGIGIDITRRRSLEDEVTQSSKMEALGRLAGGVAHDFNNLLTVISGYAQLALEGVGGPADRTKTYVQEILNSSRRAAGMAGQLLAFSRRQAVTPAVLDLRELLGGMQELLQRVIGEYIDLRINCEPGPCLIVADAHQMEQVIVNLVVNARDAMPLGGSLELGCRRLPEPRQGRHRQLGVCFEVRDTGVGMEEAVKAHLFEPFFTSKGSGKGSGFGLSTVHGIVTHAGGEIEVVSEPGEGAAFFLYFPEAAGEAEKAPTSGTPDSAVGIETVLVAEDEPSVRRLVGTVLTRLGYDVLVAESGEEAMKLWDERQGRVDGLVTDVIMPHMSGGELAMRLKQQNADLKVLFISGYTDDILAQNGVNPGEMRLLDKPFTAEQLGKQLRELLDLK